MPTSEAPEKNSKIVTRAIGMNRSLEYIQIEPTTRCNYTCGFCAGRHMEQQDLDFSIFKRMIDAIEDLKHLIRYTNDFHQQQFNLLPRLSMPVSTRFQFQLNRLMEMSSNKFAAENLRGLNAKSQNLSNGKIPATAR
jgi:hypothetical protein